jgi:CRP/FNR family cyclic AMP-dependent transcriptional regulator
MDINLLRSVSIMRDLTDEELAAIASLFTLRKAQPKERILQEGAPVGRFYIICEGVVHIRRQAQKREILFGRLGPGSFFGEINLFDPGTSTASIYAMKNATLAVCDYESLRNFMSSHPVIGYKLVSAMMGEMSRRLRTTSARFVNSVYWSASPPPEPATQT